MDINDLSLKGLSDNGKKGFRMTIHQSRRDSCVLDGFLEVSVASVAITIWSFRFLPGNEHPEPAIHLSTLLPRTRRIGAFWRGGCPVSSTYQILLLGRK